MIENLVLNNLRPVISREPFGSLVQGEQHIFRFPNSYGASLIRSSFSYGGKDGLWEMAVVKFKSSDNTDFELCYSTDITHDVIGYLAIDDVSTLLMKIKELETPKEKCIPREVNIIEVIQKGETND